jgi:hypothetical protein
MTHHHVNPTPRENSLIRFVPLFWRAWTRSQGGNCRAGSGEHARRISACCGARVRLAWRPKVPAAPPSLPTKSAGNKVNVFDEALDRVNQYLESVSDCE